MSSRTRRGLPEQQKRSAPRTARAKAKSRPGRVRRLVRAAVRLLGLWVVLVFVWSAGFIGVKCYGTAPAQSPPRIPAPAGIAGYVRAEAFTYLTLPEWFIVFSADEYATFIANHRPSGFPYFASTRQYWQFYSSACAATRGRYPFDTGYHAMLGIIGASFTIENSLRSVYENTVGRLTELLATTDTPEDALARRTAREYGAFMHRVPWYEFPFGSRLVALWRETPFAGPHFLRKIERRLALTAEYGVKAVYGFVIGKMSGAAYGAEDLRIHARIQNAGAQAFADARVKQVMPLTPGTYIVTLPRYEEFTPAALRLASQGVRFLDIAGNDDLLMTVLARRGVPADVPRTRLIAVAAVVTDPTMQRFALSVPVDALGETAAFLARQGATVERLYDY